jgi:hypothetical protein
MTTERSGTISMSDTMRVEHTSEWPGPLTADLADNEGWVRGWPPPRDGGVGQTPEQELKRLRGELRKRTAWGMSLQDSRDDLRAALARACSDLVAARQRTQGPTNEAQVRELAEHYLSAARTERERREAEYEARLEAEEGAEPDAAQPVQPTSA